MTAVRHKPLVLLTNPIHATAMDALEAHAKVVVASSTDAQDLVHAAADAEVIVVRALLPPAALVGPRLRGVVRHGAGLDMIPVDEASLHGVAVANIPDANAVSVAEYAIGQMLTLAHRLHEVDRTLRKAGWRAARALAEGSHELAGRTLGIVGMGAVGREVARIAHEGLRMRVLATRRTQAAMPAGIEGCSLGELFTSAHVVVLACSLNDSTRGLVTADLLARMHAGAFLINVARGPLVDETALVEALRHGPLGGAALDVFVEQPLPPASPLLAMPNVIVSAHLAGLTDEAMQRMGEVAVAQTLQLLRGEPPRHWVNAEHEARIRARLHHIHYHQVTP